MADKKRQVTQRLKNRLMLAVAMFIACSMGLVILLDTRHVGNQYSPPSGNSNIDSLALGLVNPNIVLKSGNRTDYACIIYTTYAGISIPVGQDVPKLDSLKRPEIMAFFHLDLAPIYNFPLLFADNLYYDFNYVQKIPDVDGDGVPDIFASIAQVISLEKSPFSGGNYTNLEDVFNNSACYDVLISGANGTLIGGSSLQEASFSSHLFTQIQWVDYNFTAGTGLVTRDILPDMVGLYNITNNSYVEAYHLDLLASNPLNHLAWAINNSQTNFSEGFIPLYQDIKLVNSTNPNDTMVLINSGNGDNFIRVYACNGSFSLYSESNIVFAGSTCHDFTGDGVDEIYLVNRTANLNGLNFTVFDLMTNTTLRDSAAQSYSANYNYDDFTAVSSPSVSASSTLPDVYMFVNYKPQGSIGNDNSEFNYSLWHVILSNNGISKIIPLDVGVSYGLQKIEMTLFQNSENYDLAVQTMGGQGTTKDITVYNGASLNGGSTPKVIVSQSPPQNYNYGIFYLIPDIGGNGVPDMLFVSGNTIATSSFESIFFWQWTPVLTILFFLCIIGFIIGLVVLVQWRKELKKATDKGSLEEYNDGTRSIESDTSDLEAGMLKAKSSPLTRALTGFIIALVAITAPFIVLLRLQSAGLPIMSDQVRLAHSITAILALFYGLIPVVAVLYNVSAPVYATSLFIQTQAKLFSLQPGKIDYRVLVLDYGTRQRRSVGSYLSRSIFPMSLAITVGLFVFSRFTTGAVITNFNGGSETSAWVLNFELFCTMPIILTFALAAFLVPSSWLLDDAGVVYFLENLIYRQVGDVGKISDWLLKYLKAIAGLTALYTYVSLFLGTNFIICMGSSSTQCNYTFEDILMTVNVLALIAGFPFIGGLIYMLVAQLTVENNLPALKAKLYDRMNKLGIDTTPRQLRDILAPEARDPVEFKKFWQKSKGEFVRATDQSGENEQSNQGESSGTPASLSPQDP
ncbi:MAG TPA: hypothetical protein VKK79_16425 [Candidatus Lokiarchaeia archaeon]|nr:hypothetical protein [Candidatus Lokiarchaeia archaeon]